MQAPGKYSILRKALTCKITTDMRITVVVYLRMLRLAPLTHRPATPPSITSYDILIFYLFTN